MSWPHVLSLSRVLASPIVAVLILSRPGDVFAVASIVFFLASLTDLLDGRLARYSQRASAFGVFLDTTSDKVLVALTLVAMAVAGLAPSWMVLTILGREYLISGLRSYAASCNIVISSHLWGKGKTALTMFAICVVLLAADGEHGGSLAPLTSHDGWVHVFTVTTWILGVATALTVISGLRYVTDAWPLFHTNEVTGEVAQEELRRMAAGGDRG